MLDLGEDRVRAIAPEVGGGFGAKINIYGEEYVAAALSRRLGLPIKWIEDRSEAFLAAVHGRDLIAYVELAATRNGKVLGLRMRIIADIGAYNMLLTARVPTHSMTMANATYAFPAIRATLTEVFTNKTPTDAYRGAGRPEAAYFVERAMDMLARELEMDPADLRRKNFIQPDQFPYRTQMGAVYDSGDYEKALDHALNFAGWQELERERDAARAGGSTGQIHGGLAQGIGQALIEEVAYDADGQPLTASFMDYALPRASDFPRFELDNTVTPTTVNPLGAKGVGEAGTIGSTPCIVNAVVDALSGFGVRHLDMMLRPEKLWRIIQSDA